MRMKKVLAVAMTAALAMTSLAGCGGSGNSTTTASNGTSEGGANGEVEKMTLKVWAPQED